MTTPCDYCLFGENASADSLRGALRNFWREVYRRNPTDVRDRAHPTAMGMRAFPAFISKDSCRTLADFRLDEDLWVALGSPNRQNLERTCWDVLQAIGLSRSDFVIYDFPNTPMFPNDSRYSAVTREFKRMQAAHTPSCECDIRPMNAFLRIRKEFRSAREDGK